MLHSECLLNYFFAELKETTTRLGADIKEKVVGLVRSTLSSFTQIANFYKQDDVPVVTEESEKVEPETQTENDDKEEKTLHLGNLNNGRRVDYVLQEAPFEIINEYIFAIYSHVCYWDSEDTILFMIREIYNTSMGIVADSQIPQQSMTIERNSPASSPKNSLNPIVDGEEE